MVAARGLHWLMPAQVPELLKSRKWDAVRAILITPPLSDCWGKNARPLLRDFAAALGDSGGDELAALEAREDAMSHLRHPPCGHQNLSRVCAIDMPLSSQLRLVDGAEGGAYDSRVLGAGADRWLMSTQVTWTWPSTTTSSARPAATRP